MSHHQLTQKKRIELAILLRGKHTQKNIAQMINVHPSTVSRELKRNWNKTDQWYKARTAKKLLGIRRKMANQRLRKLPHGSLLLRKVLKGLRKYWAPEQIAGRLQRKYGKTIVCHETIYRFIYYERPDLKKYLRCQKGKYRRRHGENNRRRLRDAEKKRRIDVRPEIVEQRKRIGDWEGDTIVGGEKTTGILTHVERKSGYLLADKLERATADAVCRITIQKFKKIPRIKRRTITYDNGSAFAEYEFIERATMALIYFANPYHSWERGTNENTNGLLRQFFPKKMPFATLTQKDVEKVVSLINNRPRKRLHYLTPKEVFSPNCISI